MKCYFLKEEFLLKECELFVILFLRFRDNSTPGFFGGIGNLLRPLFIFLKTNISGICKILSCRCNNALLRLLNRQFLIGQFVHLLKQLVQPLNL